MARKRTSIFPGSYVECTLCLYGKATIVESKCNPTYDLDIVGLVLTLNIARNGWYSGPTGRTGTSS